MSDKKNTSKAFTPESKTPNIDALCVQIAKDFISTGHPEECLRFLRERLTQTRTAPNATAVQSEA
jgi:hypothetical protein